MSLILNKRDIIISCFPNVGDSMTIDELMEQVDMYALATLRVWLSQIRKETGISLRVRRSIIVRDE